MKFISISILLAFFLFSEAFSVDEAAAQEAERLSMIGEELVNKGEYDKALTSFNNAMNLDPENIAYPYEIALTYFKMKRFQESVKILDSLKNHSQCNDKVYQLLITAYEYLGKAGMAMSTCLEGLDKYPASGRLYTERGMLEVSNENIRSAITFWEKGITVDPLYPDNYFRLAQYYETSPEKIWALVYAEIYMNLSLNRQKMMEMSKMLDKLYSDAAKSKGDSAFFRFTAINFKTVVNLDTNKLPFQYAFQKVMEEAIKALPKAQAEDAKTNLRKNFIKKWYSSGFARKYPNALFERLKTLNDNAMLPMYDGWLFKSYKETELNEWARKNQESFIEFGRWFELNPLILNKDNFLSIDRF